MNDTQFRLNSFHLPPNKIMMRSVLLTLLLLGTVPMSAQYSTFQGGSVMDTVASGDWRGTFVSAQGLRYELLLHITTYINGPCQATFDVINLQQYSRNFSSCSFDRGQIQLMIDSADASFEGQLITEQAIMAGTWRQGRTASPVRFQKVQRIIRTQEPTGSETYVEHAFNVINRAGGAMLGGTLWTPTGSGPFPIFVLVSDRGHHDRNATDPTGHRPFLVMAHHFAQQGWASLRMDDRGVGASGSAKSGTLDDQVSDLVAVIDRLRAEQQIMLDNVVLLGHGDGGLVATEAARQRPDAVAAVICAGTASIDGRSLLVEHIAASDAMYGVDEEVIDVARSLVGKWYDAASSTESNDSAIVIRISTVTDSVIAQHTELLAVYPAASRLSKPDKFDYIRTQLLPWLRTFTELRAPSRLLPTPVPTLAMLAERDVITPLDANKRGWRKIAGESNKVDVQSFPDTNHGFQICEECTADEAARSPVTVSPEVLRAVITWSNTTLGRP